MQITPELFDRALLKRDREKFLDLFLEKKTIVLHQYLNHKKLLYLFNQLEKPEFFCHVCLEGILAKIPVSNLKSRPFQKFVLYWMLMKVSLI